MRIAALILAAGLAFTLGGCVKDDGPIVPKPLPSSTPIFASDEEALAAAEEAYGNYLAVLDEIYHDGGSAPERLEAVATADVVEHEQEGFDDSIRLGQHTIGETRFDSVTLQASDMSGGAQEHVISIYVCEDFAGVDVLSQDGTSVVSPGRQVRWPLTVVFDSTGVREQPLVVSDIDDWTGQDFCAQ